jgi:tetratricopeptide (TPR) repeat protein
MHWRFLPIFSVLVLPAVAAGPQLYPTDYFRSQEFRDSFLATMGVKSDVEPKLTEQEQGYMEDIQPHLADALDESIRALLKITTPEASARFDYELGMLYFRKGDMPSAEVSLLRATTKFDRFLRAHQNLGLVFTRANKHAKAVEHLTKAVALGQADEQLYGLLGYAYMQIGQPLSAETAYRNAIMLGPKSLDWKMGLAQALFKQAKAAEAVALIGELLLAHPERHDLMALQASAMLANKTPMDAAKNLEMLSLMDKATPEHLTLLGDIYLNDSLYTLSADAYLRAVDKPGMKVENAVRASEMLAQRGATEAAKSLIVGIQKSQPGLDPVLKTRLLKTQARAAFAEEATEEAVKLLEQLHETHPLDGEAILLLADHYSRSGAEERGVFYLERALKVPAVEADASVRLAQQLMKQIAKAADKTKRGEGLQRAIELLKRAQELKPRETVGRYLLDLEKALSKLRGA